MGRDKLKTVNDVICLINQWPSADLILTSGLNKSNYAFHGNLVLLRLLQDFSWLPLEDISK